jgi:DNA-binding HxlR family transcriptional regulator
MRKQRYARYPSALGCGVEAALEVIGGKWKGLLLHQLIEHGTRRFGELRSLKPKLSARILTAQLQELEEDGIVVREAFPVVPPKVEYSLSEYGKTLVPLVHMLQAWGDADQQRRARRRKEKKAEVTAARQESSARVDDTVRLDSQTDRT